MPGRKLDIETYNRKRDFSKTGEPRGRRLKGKGDSFVVPLWQWHGHENPADDEAVLFSITDRPVMDSLQLYREESAQ